MLMNQVTLQRLISVSAKTLFTQKYAAALYQLNPKLHQTKSKNQSKKRFKLKNTTNQ